MPETASHGLSSPEPCGLNPVSLPDKLPADCGAARDPILRKHPEILLALLDAYRDDDDVLVRIGRCLGESEPDPILIFGAMVAGGDYPFDEIIEIVRDDVRESTEDIADDDDQTRLAPSRFLLAAFLEAVRNFESGGRDLAEVVGFVPLVYTSSSGSRYAALQKAAPRLREILLTEYPELSASSGPNHANGQPSGDLHDWAEGLRRERAAFLARAERAESALAARARDLRRERAKHGRALLRCQELEKQIRAAEAKAQEAMRRAEKKAGRSEQPSKESAAASAEVQDLKVANQKLLLLLESERRRAAELEAEIEDVLGSWLESEEGSEEQVDLAGKRVLVVGGVPKNLNECRRAIAGVGGHLVHDSGDPVSAIAKLASADYLVFSIRHLGHSSYFKIKDAAKSRGVALRHWDGRAPETLVRLFARNPYDAIQHRSHSVNEEDLK